jgi:nitronate monooxygenase
MPDNSTLCDFLNALLEAERAGAKSATLFRREYAGGPAEALIEQVRVDEAWCCGMLAGWVTRLHGAPSLRTGDFLEKVLAKNGLEARLGFLNRGQEWVVRKLEEILPQLDEGDLRRDLAQMLELHARNIAECAAFLDSPKAAI